LNQPLGTSDRSDADAPGEPEESWAHLVFPGFALLVVGAVLGQQWVGRYA
jgi:hypothetical protein